MSILINDKTQVIVQGLTGRSGTFYTDLAMRYAPGTYVGGVRLGKGGRRHIGLPVFDTVAEARQETGANASLIMVPAHGAADAVIEAAEAGIELAVCVTERVPVHDMVRVKAALARTRTALVGPNSQGILTPDACKIGVMSTAGIGAGRVGIVSRSASLTSEVASLVSAAGMGLSTLVGIGGDPIHGIGFAHCLERFRDDPDTEAVVLIGEIGGDEEERAADFLAAENFGKPVVVLLVGRHAPTERRMGHAGTLSILGAGSIERKAELLEDVGARIANSPDDIVGLLRG